jgi:lipopolysaccharide export system permease protein
MQLSGTLSRYLAKQFLLWFLVLFVALLTIVFLADMAELLRRASRRPDVTLTIVVHMALLNLPHMIEELLPFGVLFGAIAAFWRLTRNHELVVVRAAGVSAWQFLLPILLAAAVFGVFKFTVLNPIAATTHARFQAIENRELRALPTASALSSTGFWLRDSSENGQIIVHATSVSPTDDVVADVRLFAFDLNDRLQARYDAARAELGDGLWRLRNVWISRPDRPAVFASAYDLPTAMTASELRSSYTSPDSVSFWDLPPYIALLEAAGLPSLEHRLQFNKLMAEPLLLCAMVLLAATFSLRHQRRGGVALAIGSGVAVSFMLYILSDVVFALGLAAQVPIELAAWTPASVTTLIGLSSLMYLEEG